MKQRKIATRLLLVFLISIIAETYSSFASALNVVVKIDGSPVSLSTKAYTKNDDVMIPARDVFEAFGAGISWGEKINTAVISAGGTVASVQVGNNAYYINSSEKYFHTAPEIVNDKLCLPSSVIEEFYNYNTEFDAVTSILNINTKEAASAEANTDDSMIDLVASADTYVKNGDTGDDNFGASDNLEFGAKNGPNLDRLMYFKFDISKISNPEFLTAEFRIESHFPENDSKIEYNLYDVDPDAWEEDTITFNDQPAHDSLILTYSSVYMPTLVIDVTDYMKSKLAEGKKTVSFAVVGNYSTGTRIHFRSKESTYTPPTVRFSYTEEQLYVSDIPTPEGFGKGQAPWEWAKKMVAESNYVKHEFTNGDCFNQIGVNKYEFSATESTYANGGAYASTNFASSLFLETKDDSTGSSYARKSYIKFDVSTLKDKPVNYAYINLWCTNLEENEAHDEKLSAVPSSWNEETLTWNNKPASTQTVSTALVSSVDSWTRFDVTEYIRECITNGETTISLCIEDMGKRRTTFGSKLHSYPPALVISTLDSSDPSYIEVPMDDPAEYNLRTISKLYNSSPDSSNPTRVLESLPGYKITADEPNISEYGGRLDKKTDATGFYYTKQIDGRWWIVDPEGYLMFNTAVVSVYPGDSPNELVGMQEKYNGLEGWPQATTDILKNDLYFNGIGAWSNTELLKDTESPLAMTEIVYFLKTYMSRLGLEYSPGGNTSFDDGAFNVFDPDFVDFCDEYAAENMHRFRDNPYFLGWMSDNELPAGSYMLDTALKLDPTNPKNVYTYTAAWEWLKQYTGKERPNFKDITDVTREDYNDFVYDRYFSVINAAIKKYDPNHLYLGCRFTPDGYHSRGIMTAAGRHCDIITMNYYHAWTPDSYLMSDWYEWSGKPFIITEWYAMAYDSGLPCNSGAGFRVYTQKDRGKFYQNFALKMLETKCCVGVHWFKYLDNDPDATWRDNSNIDGNKGIFSIGFDLWTDLTDEMAELNRQIYPVIDYFDNRAYK